MEEFMRCLTRAGDVRLYPMAPGSGADLFRFQDQQFGAFEANATALFVEADSARATESGVIAREREAPFLVGGRAGGLVCEKLAAMPAFEITEDQPLFPIRLRADGENALAQFKNAQALAMGRAEGGVF